MMKIHKPLKILKKLLGRGIAGEDSIGIKLLALHCQSGFDPSTLRHHQE